MISITTTNTRKRFIWPTFCRIKCKTASLDCLVVSCRHRESAASNTKGAGWRFWNKLACTNIFSGKRDFRREYTRNHIYSIFQPILIYGGFSARRTMDRLFCAADLWWIFESIADYSLRKGYAPEYASLAGPRHTIICSSYPSNWSRVTTLICLTFSIKRRNSWRASNTSTSDGLYEVFIWTFWGCFFN